MKHHKLCPQSKTETTYCFCERDHVDGPPETCPASECMTCAMRFCPFLEPLHFHHDGCPACYFYEMRASRSKRFWRALRSAWRTFWRRCPRCNSKEFQHLPVGFADWEIECQNCGWWL